MKRTAILTLVVFTGMIGGSPCLFAEGDVLKSETGLIRVFVKDDMGNPATDARVYIADKQKIVSILQSDSAGYVSVSLQPGGYTVSSTLNKPQAEYLDRFASPDASIYVSGQDTTSVLLTLHPLADPVPQLSLSALKKIGVADEVAKYTN